jgi:hypothetical protein
MIVYTFAKKVEGVANPIVIYDDIKSGEGGAKRTSKYFFQSFPFCSFEWGKEV